MLTNNTFLNSILSLGICISISSCNGAESKTGNTDKTPNSSDSTQTEQATEVKESTKIPVDSAKYRELQKALANGDTTGLWPVAKDPIPLNGAILPFKRVVVYYGNLYSKKMGALGEYAPKEMWRRLNQEVKNWEKADPSTPVQRGIHYIAVVASGTPGKDGSYINRMPFKQIDSAITIAKMHDAILFLDIQVGLSTIQKELPKLEEYLKLPHVHLGIDPEFSMKTGHLPGKKIGTFDAEDLNYVSGYLAKLVKDNNL